LLLWKPPVSKISYLAPLLTDSADTVSSTDSGKSGGSQRPETEVHTFKAHRVVVAARCDWFRRALLSGMRESIDRKIMVHDTTRMLFATFLEYLYSGRLEPAELPPDQLTDLMLLADRYELDNLKKACEHALRAHIDDDSVLCLLSMADQFNARCVKISTINAIFINLRSCLSKNKPLFQIL
jgi:BTB/POZ domain